MAPTPKSVYSNWKNPPGPGNGQQNSLGNQQHQKWSSDVGSPDPLVYQIKVEVNKQYEGRKAVDTVYCSCRCNGADTAAHYCKCPTGFQCVDLLNAIKGLGGTELAGSYCVKEGTEFTNNVTSTGQYCLDDAPGVTTADQNAGRCGSYNGH